MWNVEPVELALDHGRSNGAKPYIVKVNGWTVTDKRGTPKRFKDSIAAAIGGARHVDWLKSQGLLTASDAGAEPMNYPTGEAEILALPEAPRDAKLFTPLLAVGQILSASGEGGKTLVTAVKVVNGDGAWMKRTIDSSGEQP